MDWIEPDWQAVPGVRAAFTLRSGGVSRGPWASLNLATHVGDESAAVAENRRRLRESLRLPAEPAWLAQVHGRAIVPAHAAGPAARADASWTDRPGTVCAILVADCLPVLLADDAGRAVAAVHAGWRGLAAGVIEAAVARLRGLPGLGALQAWLGPCIGPAAFEVGPEVRAAFVKDDGPAAGAFAPGRADRWHADLQALARLRLRALGICDVSAFRGCTHAESGRFYSFRRDGRCGRMAAVIWHTGTE